jgi:hypothetical protein
MNHHIAAAQSNISSAELRGLVKDASEALIAGAVVTIRNIDTGFSQQTTTDDAGRYRFLSLPPAAYAIRVESAGFKASVQENVQLTVGQTAAMDFTLQVGAVTEAITVVADSPMIDTQRSHQSTTISETSIRSLPIDRRDYLTFVLLAPGTLDSTALADNADFRVAQTAATGLSFYGNNGRGNSITIDGAEANTSGGGVRPTLGQEAVQEFEINRSNYAAEFGASSGAVINIVSKSGTNDLHGTLFGFFRHHDLDAADPFAIALVNNVPQRIKPAARRQQYGATLGFPIRRDRTFFFGSFEGLNRNESAAVPILTDPSIFQPTRDQDVIIQRLLQDPGTAGIGAALRQSLTANADTVALFNANSGVFPFTTKTKMFSARLDHVVSNQNQLFLRTNITDQRDSNQSTRALVGPSRSNVIDSLDAGAVAGWTAIPGPSKINELRVQWHYRRFFVLPNDANGPELNITGFGFFNRDFTLPSYTFERRAEAADNFTYAKRNHRVKAGGSVLARQNTTEAHAFLGGRFNFGPLPGAVISPALGAVPITSLQAFSLGVPQSYQAGFGNPRISATLPLYGLYAQDTWNVRPNFTLNYGLRYELDDRKDPLPTDKNNFAPRFGFAWEPWNDRNTTVRGGYGIFYSPIYFQIDYAVTVLNEIDGFRQIAQVLSTLNAAAPQAVDGPINIFRTLRAQNAIAFPASPRAVTAADLEQFGIRVSHTGPRPPLSVLFRHDPNYRNAYSQQVSFGIEHQLTPGISSAINYISANTLKITRARDINLLPRPIGPRGIREWTAASGCAGAAIVTCFRDPQLLQENLYESSGRAFYHGMSVEVSKRAGRITVAGNYTLSKAIDEVTDFNSDFQPNDQIDLRLERGLSAFDQRHKVVAYANVQTPFVGLSPIFRANSGRPFNLLVGGELNGDRHSTTDRPPFAGRNTGRGPGFWTFDLRVSRRVGLGSENRSLEVIAEAFNLFNRLNFASVNNTVGPDFRPPFTVTGRRDAAPTTPLAFTSAHDPRRFQLGLRATF